MSSSDNNQILDEAMRLHQQGKFDDARGQYQKLLASDPDNDKVIFLLANLDASTGRFEQACQAFEKAARLNPSIVDYQLRLGEVYGRLGRLDDASKVLSKALELAPDNLEAHNNLGIALASMRQFEEAAGHFAKVIEIRPDVIMAHHHYSACLNESGRSAEAIAVLKGLLERKPDDAQALNNLGSSYLNQGDFDKAVEYLSKAVQIKPDYAQARDKLVLALHGLGRLDEALAHAEQTVRLAPGQVEAMTSLGSMQNALGEHDAALGSFEKAWSLDSKFPGAISGLAECYRLRGDYDKSEELLLPHIGVDHPPSEIAIAWAKLIRARRRPDDGIPVIERALAAPQLSHTGRVQLGFALGQLLDQRGDFERAWRELEIANELKGTDFDRSEHSHAVDAVMNSFSSEAMQSLPRSKCASELPVFIVGMPRVGKTIVEQIIASHPAVYGAGELSIIGALSASIMRLTGSGQPYPLNIASLGSDILNEFSDTYIARLSRDSGDARRVSDTMPMNFFHIGFIELMFPNARIIHCTRDPGDTLLSCFSKNFRDPLINFSYGLDDVTSFYADYKRLMEHFRSVSSLAWLDISYEKLVSDTAKQSRELIAFLGLEWHADCERYYEKDIATTSSPDRIHSPLNSDEIGRAKNYPRIIDAANPQQNNH